MDFYRVTHYSDSHLKNLQKLFILLYILKVRLLFALLKEKLSKGNGNLMSILCLTTSNTF